MWSSSMKKVVQVVTELSPSKKFDILFNAWSLLIGSQDIETIKKFKKIHFVLN